MTNKWFTYEDLSTPIANYVKSDTYGLIVDSWNVENSAARNLSFYSVAGRNGGGVHDSGYFQNFTLTINVALVDLTRANAAIDLLPAIKEWLLAPTTYQVIAFGDGASITQARIGILTGNIAAELINLERYGKATLTFNCKPPIYDLTTFTPVTFTTSAAETNSSLTMPAYPFIEVATNTNDSIKLTFVETGGITMTLDFNSGTNTTVYVDCETGEVYGIQSGQKVACTASVGPSGQWSFPYVRPGKTVTVSINLTRTVKLQWRLGRA